MNLLHEIYVANYENLIVILAVATVPILVLNKFLKDKKWYNILIAFSVIIYALVILYIVLFKRESGANNEFSLELFDTYRKAKTENIEYYREAFMNVILFYPFGLLFSSLNFAFFKKKKWLVVPLSILFSTIIEIVQYAFSLGYAEIDDVFHNFLGALIGFFIFEVFEILYKFLQRVKERKLPS